MLAWTTRSVYLRVAMVISANAALVPSTRAAAQTSCTLVCNPAVSFEPAVITNHLFSRPTTRTIATGAVQQLQSASNLELIFSVSAATPLKRISLYGSIQWLPTATEKQNPFTLYGASEVDSKIRANAPTASAGVSLGIVRPTDTSGWFALDLNVGDLYSSAARPRDASAYTHKLDLGLDGVWSIFSTLPKHTYLHGVSVSTLLDYGTCQ